VLPSSSCLLNIPAANIPPNYTPSSTAFVRQPNCDRYLLNVSLVNYRIDQSYGNYVILDDSVDRRNRNFCCTLDAEKLFEPVTDWLEMVPVTQNFVIKNLRFDRAGSAITVTSSFGTIGTYDVKTGSICDLEAIGSPENVEMACKKNWILLDQDLVIYNWFPYSVGKIIRENNAMKLYNFSNFKTPNFFENVRGSSNFVAHGGSLVGIVHLVQSCLVRRYMHMVVFLSLDKTAVDRYSLPFFFFKAQIERVLSIDVCGDSIVTCVSQYDSLPTWVRIPLSTIPMFC
jgi:hypothetical protein